MRVFINGQEVVAGPRQLTKVEWTRELRPGRQMVCTYRWYWENPSPNQPERCKKPADGRQLCTIANVRATQMTYSIPGHDKLQWMDFPRASELKATANGFDLYFPNTEALRDPANGPDRAGKLMSRYEWIPEANGKLTTGVPDVFKGSNFDLVAKVSDLRGTEDGR